MIFKRHKNGFYYYLDKDDWKYGDVRGFVKAVSKLKTWVWPAVEFDTDEWAFVGATDKQAFAELKRIYIDRPKQENKALLESGYKPLKQNTKFRRRAVVRKEKQL